MKDSPYDGPPLAILAAAERVDREEALDLLRECRKVLGDYWFTTVDCFGGDMEDVNNEDVIELCERLDAFFAGQEAGQ